jgi:hypothetical protein
MPLVAKDGKGFEELGCGHYGCVMPTQRADVVFKLTTDPTEAVFVRAALEISKTPEEWPAGMIVYHSIHQLGAASFRGRPIFAIWRQEASRIGFLIQANDYEATEAQALVANAQESATFVRAFLQRSAGGGIAKIEQYEDVAWNVVGEHSELLDRRPSPYGSIRDVHLRDVIRRYRGAMRAAVALRAYDSCIEAMHYNSPIVTTVGRAMEFYRAEGIVLADVHMNNIGIARHSEYGDEDVTTITDPGHALFLDDRFDKLAIDELRA